MWLCVYVFVYGCMLPGLRACVSNSQSNEPATQTSPVKSWDEMFQCQICVTESLAHLQPNCYISFLSRIWCSQGYRNHFEKEKKINLRTVTLKITVKTANTFLLIITVKTYNNSKNGLYLETFSRGPLVLWIAYWFNSLKEKSWWHHFGFVDDRNIVGHSDRMIFILAAMYSLKREWKDPLQVCLFVFSAMTFGTPSDTPKAVVQLLSFIS